MIYLRNCIYFLLKPYNAIRNTTYPNNKRVEHTIIIIRGPNLSVKIPPINGRNKFGTEHMLNKLLY
jgi:hypothetical protein